MDRNLDNLLVDFETFKGWIVDDLNSHFINKELMVSQVAKTNIGMRTGINIKGENKIPMATIYIENMYDEYLKGESYNTVLNNAIRVLKADVGDGIKNTLQEFNFDNREQILSKAYCEVIGIKGNKKMLYSMPYIKVEDMAIIYKLLISENDEGLAAIKVNNQILDDTGISLKELHERAIINTQDFFPVELISMPLMFGMEVNDRTSMFILTNRQRTNGAMAAFYPGALQKVAKSLCKDIYVLPSSIHEVILMPDTGENVSELRALVKDMNRNVVSKEDKLTDSVYRFRLGDERLSLCKEGLNRNRGLER